MIIRREQPDDLGAISAVIIAAFRHAPDGAEPPEAELVVRLRADEAWLPHLSLVAVAKGAVIGHILCTRGFVEATPALGLAPLAVQPCHQGQGVGRALVHAALGAADATDEPLVCVLGDPGYYSRFGFTAASDLGVVAPEVAWGRHFQARALTCYRPELSGRFRYARPIAELGLG